MTSKTRKYPRCDLEGVFRLIGFAILLAAPLTVAAVTVSGGFLWFAIGAIAWSISVAAKIPLADAMHRSIGDAASFKVRGAAHGALSAVCELGCTAVCFLWILADGSAWNAASFGAGAGWIEVIVLLIPGLFWNKDKTPEQELDSWHVRWTFLVERTEAILLHIGARGLVWLAIRQSGWFAIPAFAGFAVVDGLAVYGTLQKWEWLEQKTWRWFFGIVAGVSLLEVFLFIMFASFGFLGIVRL